MPNIYDRNQKETSLPCTRSEPQTFREAGCYLTNEPEKLRLFEGLTYYGYICMYKDILFVVSTMYVE